MNKYNIVYRVSSSNEYVYRGSNGWLSTTNDRKIIPYESYEHAMVDYVGLHWDIADNTSIMDEIELLAKLL